MGSSEFTLLEDPARLAQLKIWTEPVCRDLLAVERGELDEATFRERYVYRKAVLVLDITGFTSSAMDSGEIAAFLRILNVHKICEPILRSHGAELVRAFADDLVAIFDDPGSALKAAFAIHSENERFSRSGGNRHSASCCIGIGYGDVFAFGPNLAMGDEMNRASKLGEDTAEAGQVLLTESAHAAVGEQESVRFFEHDSGVLPFSYFEAVVK